MTAEAPREEPMVFHPCANCGHSINRHLRGDGQPHGCEFWGCACEKYERAVPAGGEIDTRWLQRAAKAEDGVSSISVGGLAADCGESVGGEPTDHEAVAIAARKAFLKVTSYWPPKWIGSADHVEKMLDAVSDAVAAALRSSPPIPPSGDEPTLASLWGICPDITGGLSSEEFVRRQRAASEFLRQQADADGGRLSESDREYFHWIADDIERLKDNLLDEIQQRRSSRPVPAGGELRADTERYREALARNQHQANFGEKRQGVEAVVLPKGDPEAIKRLARDLVAFGYGIGRAPEQSTEAVEWHERATAATAALLENVAALRSSPPPVSGFTAEDVKGLRKASTDLARAQLDGLHLSDPRLPDTLSALATRIAASLAAPIPANEARVPGTKVCHAIITPECRTNRTAEGALKEAFHRIKGEYMACNHPRNVTSTFHIALTVQRGITPTEDK